MLNNIAALMGGATAAVATDYESIATTTVGSGGSANIDFTSIASTYSHLQVRGIIRTTTGTNNWDLYARLNNDSASNYAIHSVRGEGSGTPAAEGFASQTSMVLNRATPGDANIFGGVVIDFLDYANTNKYKTMRGLAGQDRNGSGIISFNSSLWLNTAAVNRLTFTLASGNFAQYSTLALYGIK